jgi:cytochrome b6-f complex iron-sulfur subunit
MTNITRREFFVVARRFLYSLGAIAIFGPVIAYFFPAKLEEMPSEPVLVGKTEDLPVGESKTVRFGRYPALILNTSAGLRAYSAVCTHFACIVKWNPELGQIVCPCHEGYFDPSDGSVISGPPPEPLVSLSVEVVDGEIFVGSAQ